MTFYREKTFFIGQLSSTYDSRLSSQHSRNYHVVLFNRSKENWHNIDTVAPFKFAWFQLLDEESLLILTKMVGTSSRWAYISKCLQKRIEVGLVKEGSCYTVPPPPPFARIVKHQPNVTQLVSVSPICWYVNLIFCVFLYIVRKCKWNYFHINIIPYIMLLTQYTKLFVCGW